ncbi:Nucleotide-alpha-beta plait [Cordyceps militaris]|uniref:Nucleotide-alpha-beta plait n=1 Tax=Cordyceps militaris TaxID=73501 RepID=A0A2H4SSY3_CORMI|nr:Nucleotide-alpha-beta plait [Cordyceps militaris]
MSYFDQNVDGGVRVGDPNSSGDATPTPQTPTDGLYSRNGRLTPSPHYARPRPIPAGPGDGGAAPRRNLRNIWEGANRPSQTGTTPNVVFPASPNSSDYSVTSIQHGLPSRNHGMDANDWETGLERLRLDEDMPRQLPASGEAPRHVQTYYGSYPHTRSPIPPPVEPEPSLRQLSIWSAYGNQASPNHSAQNGGISSSIGSSSTALSDPYLSFPPPMRYDAVLPSYQSRTSPDADLPAARRPFTAQHSPPVPMRMGQSSQYNAPAAGGPSSYPPPVPFLLQPRFQGFLPMQAIRSGREPSRSSSSSIIPGPLSSASASTNSNNPPAPSHRFSDRYHGMHTESNASAEHLSAEQNASLWITNLPPDITHRELLAQIRYMGRIWCCFINGPDGLAHSTAAAKVVFFQPAAAQRLLAHALEHGLVIRQHRAKVAQNRIKTGGTTPRGGDDSRVLLITGQDHFVNEKTLTAYFGERFVFQIDEVKTLIRGGGRAVVEFRFGSYRCQAQMGKISLEKDRPLGFEKAEFGEDPCEVGETWTSHQVALLRIRGIGL